VIDSVLGRHLAEVDEQVLLSTAQRVIWLYGHETVEVWAVAYDKHLVWILAPARERDPPIGLIGRDDHVGEAERDPLRKAGELVHQVPSSSEAGQVELGHQIVMIEDQPCPAPAQRPGGKQQDVGWIGGVHDIEMALGGEAAHGQSHSR